METRGFLNSYLSLALHYVYRPGDAQVLRSCRLCPDCAGAASNLPRECVGIGARRDGYGFAYKHATLTLNNDGKRPSLSKIAPHLNKNTRTFVRVPLS